MPVLERSSVRWERGFIPFGFPWLAQQWRQFKLRCWRSLRRGSAIGGVSCGFRRLQPDLSRSVHPAGVCLYGIGKFVHRLDLKNFLRRRGFGGPGPRLGCCPTPYQGLTCHVNNRSKIRITFTSTENFTSKRSYIAFAREKKLHEVSRRAALAPTEVSVCTAPAEAAQVNH